MTLEEFKEILRNAEKLMDLYQKEFTLAHDKVVEIAEKANELRSDLYDALDEAPEEDNYGDYENLLEASDANTYWLPSDYQCM